jgi:hypothetical protein
MSDQMARVERWLQAHPDPAEALTNVFTYGYYANEEDKDVLRELIDAIKEEP